MKHMKIVEVPASTKEVEDFVTCDICGKKIKSCDGYAIDEVNVSHRTGESFPEGGSGEKISVDMCGKCFDDKLIPWIRSQGAEPNIEDWYW